MSLSCCFAERFHRIIAASLAITAASLATGPTLAQSTVTLDATSGTGTLSTNYSTTGGLTLGLGFFAEYLVVAGGGGGGGSITTTTVAVGSGGGGAGGLLTGTTTLSGSSYSVQVGGGGAGGRATTISSTLQQGSNGGSSIFGSVTAAGGGGGGRLNTTGNAGGSGGGGGGRNDNSGGSGNTPSTTPSQGNNGGSAGVLTATAAAGGGGGGAGAAGSNAFVMFASDVFAGGGGGGLANSITGNSVIYAGGGGGGAKNFSGLAYPGTGGAGGGGGGNTDGNGSDGTDGLGGGGGGVGRVSRGGRGGSGIVIVRYQGVSLGEIGGTVTSGSGSATGYTLHTFTTTGTTTGTSALDLSGVDMNARLATTLTGTLSGSGSLTFNGPGTLALAAANTYTGDTTIAAGKLLVNGVLSSSTTTVAAAAVLGGSGTIGGAVVVGASGTLSPGNNSGILTVNSLSLSGSAFTLLEIVGSGSTAGVAGTDYDEVAIATANGLSFGGTLDLDLGNRTSLFAQGTEFQLFSFSGTTTGDFTTIRTIDASGSYAGLTFSPSPFVAGEWTTGIIPSSGDQYLMFSENTGRLVALPEPSAVVMAALGAGLAGWRLRRRRASSKASA